MTQSLLTPKAVPLLEVLEFYQSFVAQPQVPKQICPFTAQERRQQVRHAVHYLRFPQAASLTPSAGLGKDAVSSITSPFRIIRIIPLDSGVLSYSISLFITVGLIIGNIEHQLSLERPLAAYLEHSKIDLDSDFSYQFMRGLRREVPPVKRLLRSPWIIFYHSSPPGDLSCCTS